MDQLIDKESFRVLMFLRDDHRPGNQTGISPTATNHLTFPRKGCDVWKEFFEMVFHRKDGSHDP